MRYPAFKPATLLSTVVFLSALLAPAAALADAAANCSNLAAANLALPGDATSLTIDSAALVAAAGGLPEYCLVNGHLDTEINFQVELPTTWNGKILMEGNSGFAGYIPFLDFRLVTGYAVFGTDTGHNGGVTGGGESLLNRPDRIANLQYRSVHLVALTAKEIAQTYYGAAPTHAYFEGCSRGGVQAMTEVQQYPTDFDGVIAGAPSFPSGGFRLWNSQALFPAGASSGLLPAAKVALLGTLILQQCDGLDGIVDGIVDDPRECDFTPADDLPRCRHDVDGPACFTRAQVTALQKIHEGPRSNGQRIGPKFYFSGVEGYSYGDAFGVGVDILDFSYWVSGFPGVPSLYPDLFDVGMPSFAYFIELNNLRYLAFSDPTYLLQNFDYDNTTDVSAYVNALAAQWTSTPNLGTFAGQGRKLIEWHGWGDSNANPIGTVQFYAAAAHTMGLGRVKSFDRLFMVPGTAHCGGGPGPWNFDPLPVLEQWVEAGQAPDSIIGSNPDGTMTRPVCAYPRVARLKHPGLDPNVASNFACVDE
jgi:hypothetical protein